MVGDNLADQRQHVLPEALGVGRGMAGLEDAAVDAASEMLDEGAEQPRDASCRWQDRDAHGRRRRAWALTSPKDGYPLQGKRAAAPSVRASARGTRSTGRSRRSRRRGPRRRSPSSRACAGWDRTSTCRPRPRRPRCRSAPGNRAARVGPWARGSSAASRSWTRARSFSISSAARQRGSRCSRPSSSAVGPSGRGRMSCAARHWARNSSTRSLMPRRCFASEPYAAAGSAASAAGSPAMRLCHMTRGWVMSHGVARCIRQRLSHTTVSPGFQS